jgi:hypothetical protein
VNRTWPLQETLIKHNDCNPNLATSVDTACASNVRTLQDIYETSCVDFIAFVVVPNICVSIDDNMHGHVIKKLQD